MKAKYLLNSDKTTSDKSLFYTRLELNDYEQNQMIYFG